MLARVPGAVAMLDWAARLPAVRRMSQSMMPLTVTPVPDSVLRSWVAPLHDRRIRRDLVRVLRGIEPRYTLDAAERLRRFQRPTLIVWGLRDRFFPVDDAERLARTLPQARLERIDNARTFVQLDVPDRLGALVSEFALAAA
jgi:pimeloyl-ACP methyl ester carboxylesterase